jgi:hypothetical protein
MAAESKVEEEGMLLAFALAVDRARLPLPLKLPLFSWVLLMVAKRLSSLSKLLVL